MIKDKGESFHERQIKFFKKVLTRDNTDKVSYQGKTHEKFNYYTIYLYLEFLDSSLEHYRDYVAKRDN